MNTESQGIPDNLRQKFPHLRPLGGVPSLFTLNGFGMSMYGKRDFDPETETYIKTRCVCALFVPLFALGSYRVADAGSRTWYFLGRESLSNFAKSWNAAMGCLVICLGLALGWSAYTGSAEYRARKDLELAAQHLKSGDVIKAAGLYRNHVAGPLAASARQGLKDALEACLQSAKTQTVSAGLRLLAGLPASVNRPAPLIPNAAERGLALVGKFRSQDPDGALDLLKETTALDPKNEALKSLKVDLLKEIVATHPDNTNRVVELALIYEADQKLDESVKVLLPCRTKLGATEGARILGQHLLGENRNDEAYALLFPYVQTRLDGLRKIEMAYTNTIASVQNRAITELKNGREDRSFYDEYERASKTRKEEMVDEYIQKAMERDPGYQRILADLKVANRIVLVALDLGLVQLNRAQSLSDAARKAELEAAEKTFLSVRGFAGETDEYRMFLGQVYYWLGRAPEGRKLFDELLAKHQRAYGLLISLAQTLRAVGEYTEARALAEEAYQSGKSSKDRYAAAALRSLLFKDTEDQLAWLEKADPEDGWIQIELNSSRGKRALQQGNKPQAASFLQNAINAYEKLPKTASTLNNRGLACFDLYEATGNLEVYKRGIALMDEAIALAPGDSIMLNNIVHILVSRAAGDVTRDKIHPELLGEQPSIQLLGHLYLNEQERAPVYLALRENENLKKALAYLDKALLLAPKSRGLYATALSLHGSFRDLPELEKLQQRFRVAAPDFVELREDTLKSYSGKEDQKNLATVSAAIKKYEEALRSPAVREQVLTYEHALSTLVGLRLRGWAYGGDVDSASLLQLAQDAHRQHPSTASLQTVKAVYFFRAGEDLAKQSPEYDTLLAKSRRSIPPEHLLALVLMRGGGLAELARKNENLIRAAAFVEETAKSFPTWVSIEEWALLHSTAPAVAAQLATRYRENKVVRVMDELQFEYNPLSSTSVIEQFWVQKLLGDEKRATEIYQQAVREGVPLPAL